MPIQHVETIKLLLTTCQKCNILIVPILNIKIIEFCMCAILIVFLNSKRTVNQIFEQFLIEN